MSEEGAASRGALTLCGLGSGVVWWYQGLRVGLLALRASILLRGGMLCYQPVRLCRRPVVVIGRGEAAK